MSRIFSGGTLVNGGVGSRYGIPLLATFVDFVLGSGVLCLRVVSCTSVCARCNEGAVRGFA